MKRLVAAILCVVVTGCTGSVIRDVARATAVSGLLLDEVRSQMVVERRQQLDSCADEECLNRIEATWNAPISSYEIARQSHSLLVDALVIASLAESDNVSLGALRSSLASVSVAIDGLLEALRPLGLELPAELRDAIAIVTTLSRSI